MPKVQLYPHPGTSTWADVQAVGSITFPRFILGPNEAWVDHRGIVYQMSFKTLDNETMNLVLLPEETTSNAVLKITREWLLPFGLNVGTEVLTGGGFHLASELTSQITEHVIGHYIDDHVLHNSSAYFNMSSGRPLIITAPLETR